jgi:hypothetical protein
MAGADLLVTAFEEVPDHVTYWRWPAGSPARSTFTAAATSGGTYLWDAATRQLAATLHDPVSSGVFRLDSASYRTPNWRYTARRALVIFDHPAEYGQLPSTYLPVLLSAQMNQFCASSELRLRFSRSAPSSLVGSCGYPPLVSASANAAGSPNSANGAQAAGPGNLRRTACWAACSAAVRELPRSKPR